MSTPHQTIEALGKKIGKFSVASKVSGIRNSIVIKDKAVVALSIINSKLEQIPDEIFEFKMLQKLIIRHCNLTVVPDRIGQLSNLRVLDLSNNSIEKISPEIKKLKNLEVLQLYRNRIKQIPEEMGALQNLTGLGLTHNLLTDMPVAAIENNKLTRLDLAHNQIKQMPNINTTIKRMQSFNITGNPLENIPSHIQKKGMLSVMDYIEKDKVQLWQSKMVIVGQGGVGKSCLLDSLKGKSFDPTKNTTHGMRVRSLQLKHPENNGIDMTLNVWDFGGQEIYHATHQFYLTNNSFFILVWSARMGYETGKLYYWLDTIEALAPNSPVFIVATNTKARGADLPKKDIIYRYEQKAKGKSIRFFNVDNMDGSGIPTLKNAIQETASKLKHMGAERPVTWVRAAQEIQKLKNNYISRKELFKIFFKTGMNSTQYENPAEYLHEMGEILYYNNDSILKDTVITSPEWVNLHIAKILDSTELDQSEGFLSKQLMQKLWNDLEPEMRAKFVHLMGIFDIAYKVDDPNTVCLVVEKLKHEEPDFVEPWDSMEGQREVSLLYDEMNAMPAGIPTRFIARTHRFTTFTHWRHGALLKYNQHVPIDEQTPSPDNAENLALIITKPETKQIILKIRGNAPEYFSAILRDTLEYTFRPFKGLKKTLKVPCPGHNNTPCPHNFNIKHLEKRLNNIPPISTIECPEGMENVNIQEMLFGISTLSENDNLSEQIISEMGKHFEEQSKHIDKGNQEIIEAQRAHFSELMKFIELEFIKSFQVQQRMQDISCPNLFTLSVKKDRNLVEKLRVDVYFLELQLWCQHPGHQHPVGEPYEIKITRKWLKKIAPYYNRMMKFLNWTIPMINPAVSHLTGKEISASDDIKFAGRVLRQLGDIDSQSTGLEVSENLQYHDKRYELQLVSDLLQKHDPKRQWRGLIRKITPEGYIMWICEEHAKEYDIKRKITKA
ncbi:MAG: COR domain-containing protein [Bacteroidota bacterium]|nr:COR domain-containing protein [Bacteroidota bacterium]